MANKDEAAVAAALRKAAYADEFKAAFGDDVFDHASDAFGAAAEALGTFEQSAADFYPYSSRYDAFLAGKAELTAQELRGRALFEDETKGNCASCHLSEPANDGEPPQFTDFGLIAIAVPRNAALPANADPAYADLGLCGPLRTDFKGRTEYCGLFKTPTLRNVARTAPYMHDGVYQTLWDVVNHYNVGGATGQYEGVRDPAIAPLMLTDAELGDLVEFLRALDDGPALPTDDFPDGLIE
jgi:cytochrome c peroxidase